MRGKPCGSPLFYLHAACCSKRSGKCSENCDEKLEDVLPNAFLNLHNNNNNEKLEMTKSNNMMFVILHF